MTWNKDFIEALWMLFDLGANLSGADLTGANLWEANLSGADLTGTNLSKANLSGAIYTEYTAWPDDFNPEGAGARFIVEFE